MPNRRQIVSQAVKANRPRSATGGTSAPRSAARGRTTGLGRNRVAPNPGRLGQNKAFRPSAPAVGGPAGPAAAKPSTPTPWDSRYEQTVAGARKNYLDSYANFDLAEQGAKQDFGLEAGFNDYKTNPYSRAALLEESFQKGNRGTVNAAGLQLYSGSTSNRLFNNRTNYGKGRDELMKQYQEALGEIGTGRREAAERKSEEEREAYWDRVGAAEGAPLEADTAPPGAPPGAPGKKQNRKKQTQQAVANNRAVAPRKKGK